jgi:hypothetical protein
MKASESIIDGSALKSCCTGTVQNPEIYELVQLLLKNQKHTDDYVHSLQKSVAGLRQQVQVFRAEHYEDNAEVKRLLHELCRNKVWLSKEAV